MTSQRSEVLQELVAQAASGDRVAQEELLRCYWPIIRQVVRARRNRLGQSLAGREDTQDLEQAAAIKVLTELGKHEWRGMSSFAAWIKRLSELEVVDAYRHHRAQKRDPAMQQNLSQAESRPVIAPSAESRMDDKDRMAEIWTQVHALKEEYGAALLMHHLGFSHAEIGEAVGCTTEAARKLVTRARLKLLERMGGSTADDDPDPKP